MNAASVSEVVTTSYDGILEVINTEKPSIRPGHALVKVIVASVNPVDKVFARGYAGRHMGWPNPFPLVLGEDFSGIVEEVDIALYDCYLLHNSHMTRLLKMWLMCLLVAKCLVFSGVKTDLMN